MRRLAAVAALLAVCAPLAGPAAPAAAGTRTPAPYRIVPGPYARGAKPAEGGPPASRFTLQGLAIAVELLDPGARAEFVEAIDREAGDPFAAPPGRPEAYTVFRVSFENGSAADVTFQPGNVVLLTDRGEQQFTIDLTDLYRIAGRAGVADPQRVMDRMARVIFDSSTTIPRDGRLSRLLVFGALPAKWKEFRLHFSFLQIGTETHTVSFTFHKQVLKG
jgi:hypothetical protein